MELDILQDMHEEMSLAIEQGISLDGFVKTQTERLQKAGWWGKQTRIDPKTGRARLVQLGSPSRLRTHLQRPTCAPPSWPASGNTSRKRARPTHTSCTSWMRQVSKVEAEDKKWQVSERPPEKHRMVRDPNTGAPTAWPNSRRRCRPREGLRVCRN